MSRFPTQSGVYHYGRLRRSDWPPVGRNPAQEQAKRGVGSEETDSSEEGWARSDSDGRDADIEYDRGGRRDEELSVLAVHGSPREEEEFHSEEECGRFGGSRDDWEAVEVDASVLLGIA